MPFAEFKVCVQPSGSFSEDGTRSGKWCWSSLALTTFTWIIYWIIAKWIGEERKWVLVSSLPLIHVCNYLLVFTKELSPNSLYWKKKKKVRKSCNTVFVERTICFNNVSECLVAWHISCRITCPAKESRWIRMEGIAVLQLWDLISS